VKTRIAFTAPGTVLALALAGCGGGSGGVVSPPEVSFTATAETVAENGKPVITIELSRAPTEDITLNYTVGGTATGGEDFTALSGTVTVRAGQALVIVPIEITDDTETDPGETLVLTLTAGTGYTLAGEDIAFTITIEDDDRSVSTGSSGGSGNTGERTVPPETTSDPEEDPDSNTDIGNQQQSVSGGIEVRGGALTASRVKGVLDAPGSIQIGATPPENPPEGSHWDEYGVWLESGLLTLWHGPPRLSDGGMYSYPDIGNNDLSSLETATYEGDFVGIGYYGDSGSEEYGRVDADIEIKANFASDELTGTLSKILGHGANPEWGDVTLNHGSTVSGEGVTDGNWTGNLYRTAKSGEPDGVTEYVSLTVGDGAAAAAFHADK